MRHIFSASILITTTSLAGCMGVSGVVDAIVEDQIDQELDIIGREREEIDDLLTEFDGARDPDLVSGDGGGGTSDPATDDGSSTSSPFNTLTTSEVESFFVRQSEFAELIDRVDAFDEVGFETVSVSGAANYNGYISHLMASGSDASARVVSDADLTVNLGTGATLGSANNFRGSAANSVDGGEPFVRYDGQVSFSGGSFVTSTAFGDRVLFDIDGRLDNGANIYEITGNIGAAAFGENAEGIIGVGIGAGIGGTPDNTNQVGFIEVTVDGAVNPADVSSALIHVEQGS